MAYPSDPSEAHYGKYYIAASYVKFIESAGGRVVPILYDSPESELQTLFNQLNGILFPGGSTDIGVNSPLYNTAKYLLNLAMQANNNGDYFPIEAHCLGFELLSSVVAQNSSILERFDSENLSLPLNFYEAYKDSKLFGNTEPEIINILSQQAVTMNNHQYGVTPVTYSTNPALNSFFRMISWDYDRNKKAFVSTVESLQYPFYLLQWHPEKVSFEWTITEGIDHSSDSVEANEYIAQHFLSEVRKNNHKFSTPEAEYKALIYNYSPIYSASFDSSFTQIYFFP
jgi:gamma-glutamyl hydrolase